MKELAPPEDDGLHITEAKGQSIQKHHYLERYIDIFTTGMKYRPFDLHYIDLFASSGITRIEGHGLVWGSPLIAAQSKNRFHKLHLCEKNSARCEALSKRLKNFPQPNPPQIIQGDANEVIGDVISSIPLKRTLTLAFLDPYGLHLNYETLYQLCNGRKVDLLIFFPDRVDALRNFGIYLDNPDSNLDRVMGTSIWRSIASRYPNTRWAEELLNIYKSQLSQLGYDYVDDVRINTIDNRPLYKLVFCSKHVRGDEFWKKISRKGADGQVSFDW